MLGPERIESLYQQLMEINQETFEAGDFNTAYHAIMSAVYLAKQIEGDAALIEIRTRALNHQAWIDQYSPGYEHSKSSAEQRGLLETLLVRLSKQADSYLRIRKVHTESRKNYYS